METIDEDSPPVLTPVRTPPPTRKKARTVPPPPPGSEARKALEEAIVETKDRSGDVPGSSSAT